MVTEPIANGCVDALPSSAAATRAPKPPTVLSTSPPFSHKHTASPPSSCLDSSLARLLTEHTPEPVFLFKFADELAQAVTYIHSYVEPQRAAALAWCTACLSHTAHAEKVRLSHTQHLPHARLSAFFPLLLSHSRGIIHWDIACRNVLLDSRYTCRLANFCQGPEDSSAAVSPGVYCSPTGDHLRRFAPPEATGVASHDIAGDVWALAFAFYEIFTFGVLPIRPTGLQPRHLGSFGLQPRHPPPSLMAPASLHRFLLPYRAASVR